MKKYSFIIFLYTVTILRLLTATQSFAHCPLCVVGGGAGLTLTRWIGVDDSISGVWLAAFLGAIAFWTTNWLFKKFKSLTGQWWSPYLTPLVYLIVFATSLWSFYKYNLVLRHGSIFGLDKLTFGIITGGIVFYLADIIDNYLIKKNGRVFFPYQRVVVSLGSMLILSLAIFILINYYI